MDELQIKIRLKELVIEKLWQKICRLKGAMDSAQQDANQHIGAMESRYDTFKEEAQALRDGFALQLKRTSEVLMGIQQMTVKKASVIEPGSVIITSQDAYYVSTGLIEEPLEVDGQKFDCVNINAPVMQQIRKLGIQGSFVLNNRKVSILSIF